MKMKNPCKELAMQNNHWNTIIRSLRANNVNTHVRPNKELTTNEFLASITRRLKLLFSCFFLNLRDDTYEYAMVN